MITDFSLPSQPTLFLLSQVKVTAALHMVRNKTIQQPLSYITCTIHEHSTKPNIEIYSTRDLITAGRVISMILIYSNLISGKLKDL